MAGAYRAGFDMADSDMACTGEDTTATLRIQAWDMCLKVEVGCNERPPLSHP